MASNALFDYAALGATADQLIQAAGMQCSLRRVGIADRTAWAVIYDYRPKDADSKLANPTDRAAIISAGLGAVPTLPPDWEKDKLVTYVGGNPANAVDEVLVFAMPLKPINPAGTVLAYECVVRR